MLQRALRAVLSDLRLHLLSVFSVAVAFVCLSATLLLAVNIESVRARWAETGRASVYLVPEVQLTTVDAIKKAILASPGVLRVDYISSEKAREDVLASTSDEALTLLPKEAFPASLEVQLKSQDASARMEKLQLQLSALPQVESVERYEAWGQRLGQLLKGGATAAFLLLAVVLGAVVSVVGSTMRMALSRRRAEVEVMKMVGATDQYVRGPFVIEGALQGALGSLLALLLMAVLYLIIRDSFHGALMTLIGTAPRFLPIWLCLALVLLGASIGAASAYASLRRLIGSFA